MVIPPKTEVAITGGAHCGNPVFRETPSLTLGVCSQMYTASVMEHQIQLVRVYILFTSCPSAGVSPIC